MAKKATGLIISSEVLVNKIFFLRKQKVMLDRDLAELYGVIPRRLREQVKRNINNFPKHFMFQLTGLEAEMMVSQNAIPSTKHLGGALPYVFTEHGVLMLANVLKSEQATLVSIKIIEVFIKLREMLLDNTELRLAIEKLEKKTENNSKNIEIVFRYFDELTDKKEKPRKQIGYKIQKKK
ncbi:MAG: ORF6N domain-containing protein [Bacteroidota bacterium]